ncbi:DUF4097 family beta strand repeat-containing protein [Feifania hominis]|uniref:DUF4097 family beta strand repeat protein n=1 Tax=Feifania hominis TaxID=2763660 RepID=A0A926DDE1_9FIRM|nr:DUF4097 family beta strand repeat-containing protein [Feifania hominis]MBC8535259.1 DUF4097 family beta strand repeat protein [Feifania hominis]
MKKLTRRALLVAGICCALGIVMLLTGLSLGARHSFYILNNRVYFYEDSSYVAVEETVAAFRELSVDISFADVSVELSDHYGYEYGFLDERVTPEVTLDGDRLTVRQKHGSAPLHIGFSAKSNYLELYLPKEAALTLADIRLASGKLICSGLTADELKLKLDFGNMTLSSLTAKAADIDLASGSLKLSDSAMDSLRYDVDFGSSEFRGFSGGAVVINSASSGIRLVDSSFDSLSIGQDFGDITATGLTTGALRLSQSSGSSELTGSIRGQTDIKVDFGSCKIITDLAESAYNFDLNADFGSVKVNGKKQSDRFLTENSAENAIRAAISSGSVTVTTN